ncbi:DNA-binding response regulator [Flagellimonas taeanensis]|uniref:Two component transcriptional regulator, LytTR family n=1 Tax=Flagellimonas taeanensis TaxID=1005926 RepID=A0A1M6P4L6_9FLAO|nr:MULTISPECIES: LytTR family DNA-binding domain-containing protein [Allomuricauda]MDC6384949.1 LytTR family DNA-binding domain-containing protein [Muricauda sp. SK9]MEE1961104.1 LytTR family DNA-binding domain-containing protein [Allomuricauda taeanensis]RIV49075.1 DNA-binding response regulator [Allomuricauda taeanensis]SFB66319.1 two component transcriptional regulator, LytTR family [Allomuricauda taeanensis]SHK02850.1 two component transcriptional regulator, LytTR family [Allomuricauda tae
MKYKTIVIDDELLARQRVLDLLKEYPEFEIVGKCRNGEESIAAIDRQGPDVVFLDIQLKDMDGFDILKSINPKKFPLVVFITAYDHYAIEAFNAFAIDFLLKPFRNDRFAESIRKLKFNLEANDYEEKFKKLLSQFHNMVEVQHTTSRLFVRQGNKTIMVEMDNIKYIIASGYYCEIYVEDKKYVLRESLKSMLEKLNDPKFIRIHRSTIINTDFILELVHSEFNEIDVRMKNQKLFRVSKSYRKDFLDNLGVK